MNKCKSCGEFMKKMDRKLDGNICGRCLEWGDKGRKKIVHGPELDLKLEESWCVKVVKEFEKKGYKKCPVCKSGQMVDSKALWKDEKGKICFDCGTMEDAVYETWKDGGWHKGYNGNRWKRCSGNKGDGVNGHWFRWGYGVVSTTCWKHMFPMD